ncbi:MAG: hypothetical protein ACP5KI_07195, partial [Brevinematia bacterium]
KLLSSESIKINFDLLSLIREPRINSILFYKAFVDLGQIEKFAKKEEVKEKFFNFNSNSYTNEYLSISFIRFEDSSLSYKDYSFNFDLNLFVSPLSVEGFLKDTKSKFYFDGRKFFVDYLDLSKFAKGIEVKNVYGNLFTNTFALSGSIGEISYSNLVRVEGIDFKIDSSNLNLVSKLSKVIYFFENRQLEISNVNLALSQYNKGIKGEIKFLKGLSCDFIYQNGLKVNVFLKDFSYSYLPSSAISVISNFIKNFSLGGSLELVFGEKFRINGSLEGSFDTLIDLPILKSFYFNATVANNDGKGTIYLSSPRSSVNVVVYFEVSTSFNLKEISVYSKVLNLADLVNTNLTQKGEEKVDEKGLNLFTISREVPVSLRIDKFYLPDNKLEVNDIYLYGNLSFVNGEFYLPIRVDSVSFYGVKLSGEGDFSFSNDFFGKINFYKANFNFRDFYKKLDLINMGGEVYGYGFLDNLKISISSNVLISGVLSVSNVELVGLRIQNELVKLINLDLDHIFIDSGTFSFNLDGGVYVLGKVKGDLVSDFEVNVYDKTKFKFKYLKVSRSIVENMPKIFLIKNEINGIKYNLDEGWLNFEGFELTF